MMRGLPLADDRGLLEHKKLAPACEKPGIPEILHLGG